MYEQILDGMIDWLADRAIVFRRSISDALSEANWVLLSEDFTDWGLELRGHFVAIVYASYALLIVVGGLILMAHETLQTRYTARELAPRLIVGFLLAGCSFVIVLQALDANYDIASAFLESDIYYIEDQPESNALWELRATRDLGSETPSIDVMLFDLLWVVLTIVCLLLLFLVSIMRNIVWFFLVALSPIALACHALPVTEWAAQLWWRMFGACMASSIGQAVLIWVWNSLLWPEGRDGSGRYFGHIGHIGVHSLYLVVVIWMMWQIHQNAFRIARGRPLRVPGSRFVTGAATALAVGAVTGRFRKRGGRPEPKAPAAANDGGKFWWGKHQGRASSVTPLGSAFGHRGPGRASQVNHLGSAFGHRSPETAPRTAPWWDRTPGAAPEQPARPGEGAYDSMFEPANPLDHSRRLGGFATDEGRRRGMEQRLTDAEGTQLEAEERRLRQAGVRPRTGRRIADVPPLRRAQPSWTQRGLFPDPAHRATGPLARGAEAAEGPAPVRPEAHTGGPDQPMLGDARFWQAPGDRTAADIAAQRARDAAEDRDDEGRAEP
ncbi:hypothetical protein SAMN05216298_0405 [Glycomyces sambucus]|uniref:TrbL/VirB6 plasmid conjugal transfer protein n=1 Tax=Glycomyces sambucus TaxID=380244 RepID=A0A1G9CLH0_9ACTN|nr:hypothetical protein [Glycomyces sambucus]SDK52551.1 hypothetical protein SAMN05216298_0405 [Glycomyces sambucus]